MISVHTLLREYSPRSDGTFEKVCIFDYGNKADHEPRVEVIVRSASGRLLLRVERKRPRPRLTPRT